MSTTASSLRKLSGNQRPTLLAQQIHAEYVEDTPLSNSSMTTSTLRPQMQTALIRQLGKSSSHKKNLLQKGFTLVELMIVIVIVGILSAIALPNFLSQTDKAKASEAKTQASAYLKQYYTAYMEGTTANVPCPADSTNFTYNCATAGSITATGAVNTSIANKTFTASVNTTTGVITMPSGLSG